MNFEKLDYDENARTGRMGTEVNCPNCQYMNFLSMLVSNDCVQCGFEMDLAVVYENEPDGTPYYEKDDYDEI